MAAHIKQNNGYWYLFDGFLKRSLKTKSKREAEVRLKQYQEGKFSLERTPTLQKFYDEWIAAKIPPLVRESQAADYRQHFRAHILPRFKDTNLADIKTRDLRQFQAELIGKGLALKTVRNIIDASFRAMYRDARIELGGPLEGKDPFIDLQWTRLPRERPDPFTAEERDRIIEWYIENDPFYYALVAWQFYTGMRPSETFGLTWRDIDLEAGAVSINKSRNRNAIGATKTANAERIIRIDDALVKLLKLLPSRALEIPNVFVGKRGLPMSKKWAEHFWKGPLEKLGIRHRKFYATRHTFITEAISRGENPVAVAQHCGTSVAMIEKDYCGGLQLNGDNCQKFDKSMKFFNDIWLRGRDLNITP